MKIETDAFGLTQRFCEENDLKIFFGVDWLDDAEFDVFSEMFTDCSFQLSVGHGPDYRGIGTFADFAELISGESQIIDEDKIIAVSDGSYIYVSEDRDIFYIGLSSFRHDLIISKLSAIKKNTFSALASKRIIEPKKEVKAFFEHWKRLNPELSA
jgi:hypothetical protein